jgi:hypothetical protein
MIAATDIFYPHDFNVTEKVSNFKNPDFGALYLTNKKKMEEIDQRVLGGIVESNHTEPITKYKKIHLELFPEDFFLERSFKSFSKAKTFVISFFERFQSLDLSYCSDILEKLKLFSELITSPKTINCRFEIISGNSCKKFHVDTVNARLISIYAGPGTQLKNPVTQNTYTLPSCSAIIAKGSKFSNFKLTTLHRSPPIKKLDIKRFLFVADYQ